MLSFIKKLFGSKPEETAAPYKVETPVDFPVPKAKKTAAKKPTVKKATTRKPKAKTKS